MIPFEIAVRELQTVHKEKDKSPGGQCGNVNIFEEISPTC